MPTNAMDALTCEEREEVEQEGMDEMDIGLGALAHKYGLDKIMESAAHMSLATKA